jgi:hypothetical protein
MTELMPTEHQEQVTVMQWVRLHERIWPDLRMLFAVPNGGARNAITGAHLKAEGVKKGVPDILFPCPVGAYPGLAIEMKRRKGGKVSTEQKEYMNWLREKGWWVQVCRGADEAIEVLSAYLKPLGVA